jgi:hypothetical protein
MAIARAVDAMSRCLERILVQGVTMFTMQLGYATALAGVLLIAPVRAQFAAQEQQGPIEWSAGRKLAIEDFRAAAPRASRPAKVRQGAQTFLRIEASVECRDGRLEASARAMFLPSQSWWAGAQSQMWERVGDTRSWLSTSRYDLEMKVALKEANLELLQHEQLHFDMAEIAARKIRRRITQSQDTCVKDNDAAELSRFVGEVTRDFRQEQVRYDQESKHGTFLLAQGRWESRVKAALRAE